MTNPRPHEQHWLNLSEAAALTGLDREAVQSLARRGLIPHLVDDQGRWLVQIPPGSVTAGDRARSAMSNAALGEEVTGLREELARAEAGRTAAEQTAQDGRPGCGKSWITRATVPTGSRASCAPCWTRGAGNSDGAGPQALVEELLERATRAEDEVNRWRGKAEEAGQRAARAGGELAAEQRRSADLTATLAAERETARAMLALERARGDRLEAALAGARRPWLAKVLEGLRRR